jgi:hypothetical protein
MKTLLQLGGTGMCMFGIFSGKEGSLAVWLIPKTRQAIDKQGKNGVL